MNDYIVLQWVESNLYLLMQDYNEFSNLRFLFYFIENDFRVKDHGLSTRLLSLYDTTFVYNDLDHELLHIGIAQWKFDNTIAVPKAEAFSTYINDVNSCSVRYHNVVELDEDLSRIKVNPTPFIIMYRNDDWIACKGFSLQDEIVSFVEKMQKIYDELPLVRKEIDAIFLQIQNCDNFVQAEQYFKTLDDIHFSSLAKLAFVENVQITLDLRQFLRDFDRVDDLSWREYLFNKIKFENYSLDGKSAMDDRFSSLQ